MQRLVDRQDDDKYEIGNNLRNRREELGLSQDQLADIVGTSRKAVSRYETGDREMGITTFTQYVDALQTIPLRLLPRRFTEIRDKHDELMKITEELSDDDMEILLIMAKRLKK